MVLYIMKWDIHPDRQKPISNGREVRLNVPLFLGGEFRAFRPASGSSQVAVTYEFADMAAWAAGRPKRISKKY